MGRLSEFDANQAFCNTRRGFLTTCTPLRTLQISDNQIAFAKFLRQHFGVRTAADFLRSRGWDIKDTLGILVDNYRSKHGRHTCN